MSENETLTEETQKASASKKEKKQKLIDMALIAMMAALIAVCSWISIPVGEIPITLQTFAVFAAVGLLGMKRGLLSVVVYILLGAVGVPVFAGFKGGISVLFGTTGGYIVGFLFLALIAGLILDKFGKKVYVMIIALVLGLFVCYAFGTAWFMVIYMKNTGPVGLMTVLGWCVFPFIIPDLVKMALAIAITKAVSLRIKI